MSADHYVYIIFRLNGAPCYVGKGSGARWKDQGVRRAHNPHLMNIIRTSGGDLPVVKIREGMTNAEALEAEAAFIAAIGREAHGGPLVNLTDGGEGVVGHRHTEEAKRSIGEALRGIPKSDDHRVRISVAAMGRKVSEDTKAKLRDGHRRQWETPGAREKMGAAIRGKKRSPETIERMKAAIQRRNEDPEFRAKMSAIATERHAKRRAITGKGGF